MGASMDELMKLIEKRNKTKGSIIHYLLTFPGIAYCIAGGKLMSREYVYKVQECCKDPEELSMCYLLIKLANHIYMQRNIPTHKNDDLSSLLNLFNEFSEEQKAWCKGFIDEYFSTDCHFLIRRVLPFGTQKS